MENQSNLSFTTRIDDEIDLRKVFGSLRRQKALIAKITFATVLLAGLYAFTRKPVWEGQFEIVLASAQSPSSQASSLAQSNPGLANLIGVRGGNDQLETEVQILESPSVLKPVFDFVKQQKQEQGIDTQDWRYANWLQNLTVELVRGTSVLELSYRDTDKDLVLPVIQKISEAYQEYSGRDRERGIQQAVQYLDQQIDIYGTRSVKSLRAAQEYGIEQNLTALQGEGASDTRIKDSLNIEVIRIEASDQIRNIDELLKQLNQLEDNPEVLMYIGRTIPELASQGFPQQLDEMDTSLALLRAKYKEQDDSIRRLQEKRRLLIDVFRRQTYGFLYAKRSAAQARLKSAERPKGVLIKYRELLRAAARDEETLTKLESERQILALEQARKKIRGVDLNPTFDKPVGPRKKRMIALAIRLFAGGGAALWRTGDWPCLANELESLLPCPLIKHLLQMVEASGPMQQTCLPRAWRNRWKQCHRPHPHRQHPERATSSLQQRTQACSADVSCWSAQPAPKSRW